MKNIGMHGPHDRIYLYKLWYSHHISDRTVVTSRNKPGHWYKKALIGAVKCAIPGYLKIFYCLLVIHSLSGRYI